MELRLVIHAYQTNNNIGNVNPTLAIFANQPKTHIGTHSCNTT
jgi:hypothetical protein